MVETGDIFVPPEYQRQFIWDAERQSVLIESVFLGIPVPSLFMATNSDSTWEVVDGVQRLGSLSHFFGSEKLLEKVKRNDPLKLKGLTKLDHFNGVRFQDLPKSIQLHLVCCSRNSFSLFSATLQMSSQPWRAYRERSGHHA
ncbi:DUF262 domain-containing protein [Pseudomonas syringae]|uniref:DUF262 domain-containing protein n=1 Tax=Pseudomonas syringae TaxID=317 RepID=UPI0024E0B7E2|nr:DUF262 domain-containing protein [Pseudomonas syringae]